MDGSKTYEHLLPPPTGEPLGKVVDMGVSIDEEGHIHIEAQVVPTPGKEDELKRAIEGMYGITLNGL